MKKFLFSLIFLLVSYVGFSQKGLSYQAVILDPNKIEVPGQDISGQPLVNGDVWMKFSIYNGSTLQFEEVHKTRTDAYGLVNLMIGSVSTASFNALVWDSSQKSLYVYASFDQGGSYTKISEQKLTYSPYTLFAETAGKLGGVLGIAGGGTGATTVADARLNLGLDQVNNTSDAAKPVSTATQTALNLKANASDVTAGLALKANTTDVTSSLALKANTTDVITGLALKANTTDMTAALAAKADTGTIKSFVLTQVAAATIADTDASTKGKIQLAGDLAGTADAPTVPGLALKENSANKSTNLSTDGASDTKYPSVKSVKTYVDAQVSGATIADANATSKGKIQLAGDLAGTAAAPTVPGLALKENSANKSTNVSTDGASDSKYPSVKAVKSYVDAQLAAGVTSTTIADADASTKGKIQLAGDLAGTADAPTVPGLALKANATDVTTLTATVNANTASITANSTAITAETTRATAAELTLTTSVAANTASITANIAAIDLKAPIASPTFTGTLTAPIYATTPQLLTSGSTITWNPTQGLNASVTLDQNSTLSFSSTLAAGSSGTLVITQDVIGGRTITLPSTTNKVLGSNSTTSIALSEASGATDILNFYYDGTNCFWNIGQGYGINGTTNLSSSVSGKLRVANGGTGANTLTGIVKGNGTSALTAAIAGTDYQAPIILTTTGTGSATLSGTTLNIPIVSSTVNASTISGTIAVANGGTGQTTIAGIQTALGLAGSKVAIGADAGKTSQGSGAFAFGNGAGQTNQGALSVALGYVAGSSNQGASSIAIGVNAAQYTQGANSVAIGDVAGQISQGAYSVAIGSNSQTALNSVAIGGYSTSSFANSIAIGYKATTTAANTIQLGGDGVITGSAAITNVKTTGTLTAGTVTYPNTHNSTAGQLLSINATGTAAWTTPVSSGSTHAIGEVYGGGIVFYIWDGGAHGLIAATADLGYKKWGTDGTLIYSIRDGIGAGRYNTERIIQNIKSSDIGYTSDYTQYAAYVCATYKGGNFADWYLPSKYELNLLYLQQTVVGGFSGFYWTSSEYATRDVTNQNFANGDNSGGMTKSLTQNVRPIRSF